MSAQAKQHWRYSAGHVVLRRMPDTAGLLYEFDGRGESLAPFWEGAADWEIVPENDSAYPGRIRWVYTRQDDIDRWWLLRHARFPGTLIAYSEGAETATVELNRPHCLAAGDEVLLLWYRDISLGWSPIAGWRFDDAIIDEIEDVDEVGDRRRLLLRNLPDVPGTVDVGDRVFVVPYVVHNTASSPRKYGTVASQTAGTTTITFPEAHGFTTSDRVRFTPSGTADVAAVTATTITVDEVRGSVGNDIDVSLEGAPVRELYLFSADLTRLGSYSKCYPQPDIEAPGCGQLVTTDARPWTVLQPTSTGARLLAHLDNHAWGADLDYYELSILFGYHEPNEDSKLRLLVDYQDGNNYLAAEIEHTREDRDDPPPGEVSYWNVRTVRLIERSGGSDTQLSRELKTYLRDLNDEGQNLLTLRLWPALNATRDAVLAITMDCEVGDEVPNTYQAAAYVSPSNTRRIGLEATAGVVPIRIINVAPVAPYMTLDTRDSDTEGTFLVPAGTSWGYRRPEKSGTLSTRSSDSAGTVTLSVAEPNLIVGDSVDLFQGPSDDAYRVRRWGMSVTAVSHGGYYSHTATISGGTGDPLPAASSTVRLRAHTGRPDINDATGWEVSRGSPFYAATMRFPDAPVQTSRDQRLESLVADVASRTIDAEIDTDNSDYNVLPDVGTKYLPPVDSTVGQPGPLAVASPPAYDYVRPAQVTLDVSGWESLLNDEWTLVWDQGTDRSDVERVYHCTSELTGGLVSVRAIWQWDEWGSGAYGTAVMGSGGTIDMLGPHPLTADATVTIAWVGGSRSGVTVDSVTATTITVSGGDGDSLPAAETDINVTAIDYVARVTFELTDLPDGFEGDVDGATITCDDDIDDRWQVGHVVRIYWSGGWSGYARKDCTVTAVGEKSITISGGRGDSLTTGFTVNVQCTGPNPFFGDAALGPQTSVEFQLAAPANWVTGPLCSGGPFDQTVDRDRCLSPETVPFGWVPDVDPDITIQSTTGPDDDDYWEVELQFPTPVADWTPPAVGDLLNLDFVKSNGDEWLFPYFAVSPLYTWGGPVIDVDYATNVATYRVENATGWAAAIGLQSEQTAWVSGSQCTIEPTNDHDVPAGSTAKLIWYHHGGGNRTGMTTSVSGDAITLTGGTGDSIPDDVGGTFYINMKRHVPPSGKASEAVDWDALTYRHLPAALSIDIEMVDSIAI